MRFLFFPLLLTSLKSSAMGSWIAQPMFPAAVFAANSWSHPKAKLLVIVTAGLCAVYYQYWASS